MKRAFLAIICLTLAIGGASAKSTPKMAKTAKNMVIAHRGYWNTTGSFENSLSSIKNAMNYGIYGSEFDINFTKEDSIVVVHGSKHPVNKQMKIQNTSFADVRAEKLGNGETIPTLREYLTAGLADPSTQYILEIKSHKTKEREDKIVAQTLAMVKEYGLEPRVEYISFSWNICQELKKQNPSAKVYYLNGEKGPKELKDAGMDGMDYNYEVIYKNPKWVKQSHKLGMKVNVWTVDKEEDMKAMAALGVDYITTNKPQELKAVLGK